MTTLILDELKEIGGTFHKRRRELNLSLKEVENATSIRMTYLQAIEDGEVSKLISPVYAQGFVRQYANFLGIDGDSIIREHQELFNRKEPQEFAYGIGTLEMRGNPGSNVKWIPNIVLIAAIMGMLFLAWYFAKFLELF